MKRNKLKKILSINGKYRIIKPIIMSCAMLPFILVTFFWISSDSKISFDKRDTREIPHQIFKDRNGELLRFPLNSDFERLIWVKEKNIPGTLKNAFLAAEDARFYEHSGFDIKAIARAVFDNIINRRIVSGASTISQQVIRLLYPAKRTFANKFKEVIESYRMEKELTKSEIMEQYLNRVPMGNQLRGVEAASRRYFKKRLADLTLAECATLASLPKAPSYLNPYVGHRDRLFKRKDWVLKRMRMLGYITDDEYKKAKSETVYFNKEGFPSNADHLVDMLKEDDKLITGEIVTTIDLDIQNSVEKILKSHSFKLYGKGASQAAALIVDNRTMEVLAMAGSIEYSNKDQGYNNGAIALRSAGSTLKPFLYSLAFEKGYTPADILADTKKTYPSPNGGYLPANYDKRFYGPVSIRNALGNSLNISAVKMLSKIGIKDFYRRLDELSFIEDRSKPAAYYGMGMAIGNIEVSLVSLTAGYVALANYGVFRPLKFIIGEKENEEKVVIQPEAAYLVTDILSDPNARTITFGTRDLYNVPYKMALKTGTSTYFRDCWVVGYTPDYTVGVWVGNFDGSPTYMLSGSAGATPILRDIMNFLYKENFPLPFSRPEKVVEQKICGLSGMKPSKWCTNVNKELFIDGTQPNDTCTQHSDKDNFRRLSPEYAKWLYDKKQRGIEGSFRLAEYDTNLDNVFYDPWEPLKGTKSLASIRVANIEKEFKKDENVLPKRDHYTIGSVSKTSTKGSGTSLPTIVYPLPGDRFVIGNDSDGQYISMQANTDDTVEYLLWVIDSVEYAKTPPPFIIYWRPVKGEHSLTVLNPSGIGNSINFSVE